MSFDHVSCCALRQASVSFLYDATIRQHSGYVLGSKTHLVDALINMHLQQTAACKGF